MNIVESFGARLQSLRKERRLSQEQLAEDSGLHRTYISSLERGGRNPTLTTLKALAVALNIKVSELVEGVDSE